jgi:hypothetical protein
LGGIEILVPLRTRIDRPLLASASIRLASAAKPSPPTKHHLIITHEVTNVGTDRSQLANVAKQTKATLGVASLDAIADRGYSSSEETSEIFDI